MTVEKGEGVERFYDGHPINEYEILTKLAAAGADLDCLEAEQLTEFDLDHYGGVKAVEVLAQLCGITATDRVLDVCSGMGGPARWLDYTHGCDVTGIDLTRSRVEGATSLTARVGLAERVRFVHGDATDMPFEADQFDACISQEGWLHIPDKAAVVANCARVTRRMVAVTDVALRGRLRSEDESRLANGMSTFHLQSPEAYVEQFESHGLQVTTCDDLSESWTELLVERLAMYRSLRDTTVQKFGEEHFGKWDAIYEHFVGLFEVGVLGGLRIAARKA